ncbi:DUF6240 domain-containing protein [Schnuerera sp. xch1]|uniref:DUF6240 domain-containing protein n=1 Tax=Schnuerera sp. xch1 TaxID=2874283 RepID=UPI001CBD8A06|nr:DUF6240 domain-containing protein [Schnuerera sp. xch1]MBZ2175444.1 DUF6240 domain-containing protein [Schnuerera sp. xch1]
MEVLNIKNKENIIDAYGLKPTLFYDIEGTLGQKNGKDIRVDKIVEDKKISYSLRLKEKIGAKVGEKVIIDKDNILSIKMEEKGERQAKINVEQTIKKLGLEDTEETREGIEYLINNGISITKSNLKSFLASKKYLKEIVDNIDFDSCIKLLDRGVDLKEDSLQKIAQGLSEIKDKGKELSFKEILKLSRKLGYKEAEIIARNIYGRKMGKDVYDAIIALHRQRIPIDKGNIEKVLEVIDKLYDLKNYDDEMYIKILNDDAPVNIETLYKYKHSYSDVMLGKNITSSIYEQFTVDKEPSLEDILKILKKLNIDKNGQNIKLVREFLSNAVEITKANFDKIMRMKSNLKELIRIVDQQKVVKAMEDGIDPLKENISKLVDKIKNQVDTSKDYDSPGLTHIIRELDSLDTITDKDLLLLIKSGEDFKIENLKKITSTDINLSKGINEKTAQKVITISNMFNTLGGLNSDTIAFATRRYSNITLNNLYNSHTALALEDKVNIQSITKTEENIIRQEYLNIKNNTTISLIKESIRDGSLIEHMPLDELSGYIDKNIIKYNETQKFINKVKHIKGKEGSIIPIVMKNGLNMSVNQLNNINSMFYNGKGIGNIFNYLSKTKSQYDQEMQEGIEILENKIKEFTSSLKKGNDKIKRDYNEIINGFTDLNNSPNSNENNRDDNFNQIREYLDLQYKLSKDDLILQLPMSMSNEYNNINLIIPNVKKGIDENNMVFYLSLTTEKLGQVNFNLEVKGNKVKIDFETEDDEEILRNKNTLEDGLNKIGYGLQSIQPIK